jgi:choline dehydrogenase-like flavoprotein
MHAENRTNLEVLTYATAQQILTTAEGDDLKAAGAIVSHHSTGELLVVMANKKVILAARTFQSPQLLMVSVCHSYANFEI